MVVATSRELLGVIGEVAWAVPSLSLPPAGATRPDELVASDAASMFCARARAARPGFVLSAANAKAVAEICSRLDGIPLALELACARLRLLSAEQVASRLDDAFRLLTGGARTALARHQTLRATMDWSYELLTPAEQATLRGLAVFPGGFDLEAAETVVGDVEREAPDGGSDVVDILAHLVDKSLMRVESEGAEVRYRLLETVRQYGGEKLAQADETDETRRRHRDFYLARGERWRPWEQGGVPIDGADDDSFRAALEWSLAANDADPSLRLAAALWLYWLYSGHELEGCAWLERCLATPPQPHTAARAVSLIGLANLSLISGHRDTGQAQELFDEALSLAVGLGDREAESVAQRFLAVAALAQGDADRAKRLADEALKVAEASDLFLGAGWCHNTLGWVAMARGDAPDARAHFERAVDVGCQKEDAALTCHATAALAPLVAFSGEVELSGTLADQSVDAARRLRLPQLLVMTLVRSAEAVILADGGERAEAALAEALRLLGDLGARRWVADTLEMTALAREARGHPASAAHLLGACDALRQALSESPGEHRFISSKVRACRRRVAETLGAQTYDEQRTQGQRFAVPEAISYALSELGQSAGHAPAPAP
jgi:non-specific serine/threonine protein kinase